jgi:site-specific DNA-methyltransferase (adenine-specific)
MTQQTLLLQEASGTSRTLPAVVFSRLRDDWETPPDLFEPLQREFDLRVDAAASRTNTKCPEYFGPGSESRLNALSAEPWPIDRYWLNPPYSQTRAFMTKAAAAAEAGSLVVALVAARTDVRWWHQHVWDASRGALRSHVQIRFLKGRVKFVGGQHSAPFPSALVIFGPGSRKSDADGDRSNLA